jgi:tetratricopeptide (TPR) repeat protein
MDNAQDLNEKGRELHRDGDLAGAEAAYREAIAAAPHWSVPYFNLGLVYKYDSRWVESLEYNQRAAALDANDEGSWWNLGIAATALGNWSEARRALSSASGTRRSVSIRAGMRKSCGHVASIRRGQES